MSSLNKECGRRTTTASRALTSGPIGHAPIACFGLNLIAHDTLDLVAPHARHPCTATWGTVGEGTAAR